MVKRLGFSVRDSLIEVYEKVIEHYSFSTFIALCLVLYDDNEYFRNELERASKKLLKKT